MFPSFRWSLRSVLLGQMALVGLLPLLGVGLIVLEKIEPEVREEMSSRQQLLARSVAGQIEAHLRGAEREIESLAEIVADPRGAGDRTDRLLDTVVGNGELYEAIYRVDARRAVIGLGLPAARRGAREDLKVVDVSRREFVQRAEGHGKTVWSRAFLSAVSGRLAVALAVPTGQGLLIGELALPQLSRYLSELGNENNTLAMVVDSRGNLIAHPFPGMAGQQVPLSGLDLVRTAFATGSAQGTTEVDGKPLVASSVLVASTGWVVLVGQPRETAYRLTDAVREALYAGFFLAVVLAALAAALVAGRVVHNFARLADNAARLAHGQNQIVWPKTRIREFAAIADDIQATAATIKARERELTASEQRLLATLENTPNIAVQWLDDQGRIVYWNRGAESMFGVAAAGAIGRLVDELSFTPDEAAILRSVINRVSTDGKPVGPYEAPYHRADGGVGVALRTTFAIPGEGNARRFVCMDVDISQLKQMTRALAARERRFRALIEQSPVAVIEWDLEFRVKEWNEAAERIFGFTRAEALGKAAEFIVPPDQRPTTDQVKDELRAMSGGETVENWNLTADGTRILCRWFNRLILDEQGRASAYLSLVQDITDEKRNEEEVRRLNVELEARVARRTEALEQANRELLQTLETLQQTQSELVRSEKMAALGALVAGVAHELNTPIGNSLMAVTTYIEHAGEFRAVLAEGRLRRSTLDRFVANADTAAAIILRNLQKASELVVSFKQVAVDQTSAHRRTFQLDEVVGEILLTLQPSYRRTPYRVIAEVAPGITLDSFPGPLGQVLTNLINNALIHAFAERDHGEVHIRSLPASADEVRLEVIDDGVGIPDEHIRRIFDPFFTTRLGRGGSGLGLHVVHNIVTRVLGGRIGVDSSGAGTRFWMVLPRRAPGQTDGRAPPPTTAA